MGSMGNSIQVFNNDFHKVSRVGEFKNLVGLKTATYTQFYEGRATWYMNTNLGVGNSDYNSGDRSHNVAPSYKLLLEHIPLTLQMPWQIQTTLSLVSRVVQMPFLRWQGR